jgi:predicted enzyme related to lactoylglutathione lyase
MAGKVVHVEIGAADTDRAQRFWSGVFGWQVGPPMSPEMDYRMFQSADDQGGAIVATEQQGNLTVYLDTENIDASMAKIRELGGETGEKTPVPGHGWFAACRDTEGNAFSLWQGDETAA